MSFFIKLEKSDFNPLSLLDGFSTARNDYPCSLFVDYDTNKKTYIYNFEPSQHVLWDPDDTITFTLVNKIPSMARMRLHKHCCTDHLSPKLVSPTDHMQDMQPGDVYGATSISATMKLKLQPSQMVHIGLIVQIVPIVPGLKPGFLLCDPQVGSGPP
jgi:hypothetical protein